MPSSEQPVTGTGTGTFTETATDTGKDGSGHGGPENGYLPHERLDVYRVALELHAALMAALPRRCGRELRDQLIRASTSIVLNIAEGAGRTSVADKRRFYEIAKGSASESAAVLDLLRVQGAESAPERDRARTLAIRVVQMLTRLCSPPR